MVRSQKEVKNFSIKRIQLLNIKAQTYKILKIISLCSRVSRQRDAFKVSGYAGITVLVDEILCPDGTVITDHPTPRPPIWYPRAGETPSNNSVVTYNII